MQVTSSIAPIDQPLEHAATERPGEPIRIRVQPGILRKRPAQPPGFHAWKSLHWMVEVADVAEGRAFREALDAFFVIASQQGIGAVQRVLVEMLPKMEAVVK